MIAFCAGVVLSTTTVGFLASFVGSQMSSMTRHELFKNVCNFSAREINKFSIPSLITRSTNDIVQVQTSIIFFFRLGIAAPLTVILGIVKASTG
jgi:ATP-binding cassette subfamily B protein